MSQSGIERRKHERHRTQLIIRYRDRRNLQGEKIQNVSFGGVFVCSDYPLAEGEKVQLTLEAPDGKQLPVEGIVAWSSAGKPAADKAKRGSGMGIEFNRKDKEKAQKIEDFINYILNSFS